MQSPPQLNLGVPKKDKEKEKKRGRTEMTWLLNNTSNEKVITFTRTPEF